MPTIGFTTTTFTDEPTALPGLEFAIESGFHALELSGNHFWPKVMTATEARELRGRAARHGVTLSVHFPTRYWPGSPDEADARDRSRFSMAATPIPWTNLIPAL